MDLNEASGILQSLKNTFRAFERLDEVIDAARAADTALAEKTKAVDAKAVELADVTRRVGDAKAAEAARAQGVEQGYSLRLSEQQAQFDAIALSFGSVKEKLQAEINAVTEQHATETTKLLDEIRELTTKRDELLAQRDEAAAQLDQLKNRIIGA